MKGNKKLFYLILILTISILVIIGVGYKFMSKSYNSTLKYSENDSFRESVIKFIREVALNCFSNIPFQYPKELEIEGDWQVQVVIYLKGGINPVRNFTEIQLGQLDYKISNGVKGEGKGKNKILSLALEEATKNAVDEKSINKKDLKETRFLVKILYPENKTFSFIEYNGRGKELIDDLVVIRNLDKDLIRQKIELGKEYLLRMIDKNEKGAHKYYYALNDSFENRLHTIYTSSLIYTLLEVYNFEKDEKLLKYIFDSGDFVLSMQNKDEQTKSYGAFHYSYYLETKEREKKFVVGTTAKSIFTLLKLYELTSEQKYLDSAKLAGNWLITMQKPDGNMKSYLRYEDGKWFYGEKESLLYNGQVLSALSKLYKATGDKKYYDSALKIAERFREKYEEAGRGYIEDEYRKKNPISNSWVVMSLLDFYKVNPASHPSPGLPALGFAPDYYKNMIFELSEKILENQKKDENDLLNYGRWEGAYSTSGIGWISEVMTEMYRFCQESQLKEKLPQDIDCEAYKEAVIKAIRWLIQNTYSKENTFFLKNPQKALGGIFWNKDNKYIRTDSNCHALNSYLRIINDLKEGILISIPEEPLNF